MIKSKFSSGFATRSRSSRGLTLHGKVDSIEEATLSQGVHDVKKEEDEKTFHGRVQSRDREAGEAKRSSMPRAIEVGEI
jgi:hypothetical protein